MEMEFSGVTGNSGVPARSKASIDQKASMKVDKAVMKVDASSTPRMREFQDGHIGVRGTHNSRIARRKLRLLICEKERTGMLRRIPCHTA